MKKYDFLLFDADDTLFDFSKAERFAFENTFISHGFGIPSTEIYTRYHEINQLLWNSLERGEITKAFLTTERYRILFSEFNIVCSENDFNTDYLAKLGEGDFLLDGAYEMLCSIRKKRPDVYMCIVTNGVAATQLSRLSRSRIKDFFDALFISEKIGATKPDIGYFNYVFAHIPGYEPSRDRERTVIIGDSLTGDIKGGNNAGISTIWYNPHGKSSDIPYTYSVKNHDELLPLLNC